MNAKKLLIGTVVGTVFVFLIDYLFYAVLMKGKFTIVPNVNRDMPVFLWYFIGLVIFMAVFTHIYAQGAQGTNRMQQGMRFGILIGLMVGVGLNLILYSLQIPIELNEYLIDGAYTVVKFAFTGIVVAFTISIPATQDNTGKGSSGGGGDV